MKYIINKEYTFGIANSEHLAEVTVRLRMGSKKTFEYGEIFFNNSKKKIEVSREDDMSVLLDNLSARTLAKSLYTSRKEKLSNLYDSVIEEMRQNQYIWSKEFIKDCVKHYKSIMLKRLKRKKYTCTSVGYHGETFYEKTVKFRLTFDQLYRFGKSYANVKDEDICYESIDYGSEEEIAQIIEKRLNRDAYDYEPYYSEEFIRSAKALYEEAQKYK